MTWKESFMNISDRDFLEVKSIYPHYYYLNDDFSYVAAFFAGSCLYLLPAVI